MEIVIGLVILIFSAILHEVAHGFVADKLGDPTARLSGRLTLNPKSHIDPFMSILLPLLLLLSGSPVIFGAAKPVPVDPFNLKEGKKDLALVSLAGPLTNILLAIAASLLIRLLAIPSFAISLPPTIAVLLTDFSLTVLNYNLLLAIFNLIPIPPLDGSKIVAMILPDREAEAFLGIGQVGMIILFFLLFMPIGGFSLSATISHLLTLARSLLLPSL